MKRNGSIALLFALFLSVNTLTSISYADGSPRFTGTIAVSKNDKKKYPDLAKISFSQVLEIITKSHPGKIVEVALEEEDGFLVYEVELITSEHTKKEIYLDAGNGSVLHVKEKKFKNK